MKLKWGILFLSAFLVLGACSKDEDKAEKASSENKTEQKDSTGKEKAADEKPKSEAELASELVLQNTKLVKVFSINQRMHDGYQELGPFYFIRGVDEKGRKTEVWVNKGKIYEIK
jgi:hypothetical protein